MADKTAEATTGTQTVVNAGTANAGTANAVTVTLSADSPPNEAGATKILAFAENDSADSSANTAGTTKVLAFAETN